MTTRLREHDCLSEMRVDLERQAGEIKPWDADRFPGWVQACGEVLASVPDELQRIAWAWSLTQAVLHDIIGIPQNWMVAKLLSTAAEIEQVGR
ncbi:MAG: hypothetical protein Q8N00_11350 [Nitrospirota bacterium]|nr:hypothetical protein [Nitrospirota bacterium]MDP3596169.1 hypothetical protein [Nitrospirota bacterium]